MSGAWNGLYGSSQIVVDLNQSALLPITHLRAGGVSSVVTMTMITTTLKIAALTTGSPTPCAWQRQRSADPGEDQPHLAARDHPQPDRETIESFLCDRQ